MTLSCKCDYDRNQYVWLYTTTDELIQYHPRGIRKRCFSCKEFLNHNDEVLPFFRTRAPYSDIDEQIHGEEVPLETWYMCEGCAGLYWRFEELGFCNILTVDDDDPTNMDMRELVQQYNEVY